MIGNPEFRRNLWLELTPQRAVVMPLVLAAIFVVVYLGEEGVARWSRGIGGYGGLATAAKVVYLALVLLWGGRQAAAAITDEIRDRTWDGQRLSALGSWSMAWGKLFGSTVFTWYGALLALVVYALSASTQALPPVVLSDVVVLVAQGLICQATALLASLLYLRHKAPSRKPNATLFHLAGLAAVAILWWMADTFQTGVQHWPFTTTVSREGFELVSTVAFAAWGVIGVWRLMRAELQFRTLPWLWFLFLLFLIAYAAFAAGTPLRPDFYYAPAFVLFAFTYFLALVEPKDVVGLRRLLRRAGAGHVRGFFEVLPLSLLTYVVTALGVAALFLFAPGSLAPPVSRFDGAVLVLSGFLFMSRDLAILLALNLGRAPRRADVAAIVYWVVLYALVPLLLRSLHQPDAAALFRPDDGMYGVLSPLVQAVLAFGWVVWRWRSAGRAVGLAKAAGTGQIPA
jgi:hypothetical protein